MRTATLLLRLGIAFAFIFPAANALIDPYSWVGYLPRFLRDGVFPEMLLLHLFGAVEVVIGLWLVWGKRLFIPSVAATLILLLIVVLNLGDFQVLFRDLSIAAMALALAVLNRPQQERT